SCAQGPGPESFPYSPLSPFTYFSNLPQLPNGGLPWRNAPCPACRSYDSSPDSGSDSPAAASTGSSSDLATVARWASLSWNARDRAAMKSASPIDEPESALG